MPLAMHGTVSLYSQDNVIHQYTTKLVSSSGCWSLCMMLLVIVLQSSVYSIKLMSKHLLLSRNIKDVLN